MKMPSLDLVLWRHADAGEPRSGPEDLDRALSSKGERQARRMAAWLDRHLPDGTRVLSSAARRARQTAQALDRPVKLRDELGPHADADTVLRLLRWMPETGAQTTGPVLVVGHQPWLGALVARLTGLPAAACPVRKGSVWWLRLPGRAGTTAAIVAVLGADLVSTK